MPSYLLGFLVTLALFAVAAFCLWIRDLIEAWLDRRRRGTPEEIAGAKRVYEQELLNPDWEFYERHLQRPIPLDLKELYADRDLIVDGGMECGDEIISSFDPLTEGALQHTAEWLGHDIVSIATTLLGDPIYLRPGPDEANIVYTYDVHEGEPFVIANSAAEMHVKLKVDR